MRQFLLKQRKPPLLFFFLIYNDKYILKKILFSSCSPTAHSHINYTGGVLGTQYYYLADGISEAPVATISSPTLQPVSSLCPPPVKCGLHPHPSHPLNYKLILKMVENKILQFSSPSPLDKKFPLPLLPPPGLNTALKICQVFLFQ